MGTRGGATQMLSWAPLEQYAERFVRLRGLNISSAYTNHVDVDQDDPRWQAGQGSDRHTQALADVLGVEHREHIYNWRWRGAIELTRADRMCEALGVHPNEIWGEEYEALPDLKREDYGDRLLDFDFNPSWLFPQPRVERRKKLTPRERRQLFDRLLWQARNDEEIYEELITS